MLTLRFVRKKVTGTVLVIELLCLLEMSMESGVHVVHGFLFDGLTVVVI